MQAYEIAKRADGRYIINDPSGKMLDNAQGYGYTDRQKAERAAWYKFKGGKGKKRAADKVERAKPVAQKVREALTCAACGELLVGEEYLASCIRDFHGDYDALQGECLWAFKDHVYECKTNPYVPRVAAPKTPPKRCQCYKCGEPIRVGEPYVLQGGKTK